MGLLEGSTESEEEAEITADPEGVSVALGRSKKADRDSIGEKLSELLLVMLSEEESVELTETESVSLMLRVSEGLLESETLFVLELVVEVDSVTEVVLEIVGDSEALLVSDVVEVAEIRLVPGTEGDSEGVSEEVFVREGVSEALGVSDKVGLSEAITDSEAEGVSVIEGKP